MMERLPKEVKRIIHKYCNDDSRRLVHEELLKKTIHIYQHVDEDDTCCCDPILWVTTSTYPYVHSVRQCRVVRDTLFSDRWQVLFKITDTDIDWWRPHHTVEFKTPQSLRNK